MRGFSATEFRAARWRTVAAALAGAAVFLALFSHGRLIRFDWFLHGLWLLPCLLLLGAGRGRGWFAGARPAQTAEHGAELALLGWLLLYLLSETTKDPHFFFFSRWGPSRAVGYGPFASDLGRFCIVAGLAAIPCLWYRPAVSRWALGALFVVGVLVTVGVFLGFTRGALLYSDDHPSFLYRFWIFGRVFPRLVYYNPFWNGGKVATYLISSGTASLGLPFLPFWRWCDVSSVYTPVIAFAFLVLVPLAAVLSVRLMKGGWGTAFCAGILSLGTSRLYHVHLLHFGTVASLFGMSLLLPFIAGLFRLIHLQERDRRTVAVVCVSGALILSWAGAPFVMVPVALALLWNIREIGAVGLRRLAFPALFLTLWVLPFAVGLLRHADPFRFAVSGRPEPLALGSGLAEGWRVLRENLIGGNPVLLFLGVLGICWRSERGMRRWFVPILLGFFIMAGWGRPWRPHLQLDRMAVPLFLCAVVPASFALAGLLRTRHSALAPVRGVVFALLVLCVWSAARVYANKSPVFYRTITEPTRRLVEWIRTHVPEDGRLCFAGETVHGYGGGHVAALSYLTRREMLACDYYAFSPHRVEYNYPPRVWREGGAATIFDFMETYNATHVATYHAHWKAFFRKHPEQYTEAVSFMQRTIEMTVFEVRRPSAQFLGKTEGTVTPRLNGLRVRLVHAEEPVVLKYNWVDGLAVDGPVELYPVEVRHDACFIGVNPRGVTQFDIRYARWL